MSPTTKEQLILIITEADREFLDALHERRQSTKCPARYRAGPSETVNKWAAAAVLKAARDLDRKLRDRGV